MLPEHKIGGKGGKWSSEQMPGHQGDHGKEMDLDSFPIGKEEAL